MTNTTASAVQLPEGFTEVLPDLSINDKYDEKFVNGVLATLTEDGKKLRDSGKDWCWVLAGKMTRNEALKKLEVLGEGWSLPTPTDTTVGALNGIKFQGPNLVDNSEGGYDLRKDLPNVSFCSRGAIVEMCGFGMSCDTADESKDQAYFVKKS